MTEQEAIQITTGLEPVQCSCTTCQNMCKTAPCIGTPEDIMKIMKAGYIDKLEYTRYAAVRRWGMPTVEMVTPLQYMENGHCAFLTEAGLCELHDAGLKPTEGKLANCKLTEWQGLPTPAAVAATWLSESNKELVAEIHYKIIMQRSDVPSIFGLAAANRKMERNEY